MKKLLMLTASLLAWPFLSSCTEYGAYGQTGGYATTSHAYPHSYSRGYAPLRVGFISTTFDRWSYDPYRRCYYDRSIGKYYNYRSRGYYTAAPRRYSSPRYPSGYRSGSRISCPSYLPRKFTQRAQNRYATILHGSSRTRDRSQRIQDNDTRVRLKPNRSRSEFRKPTETLRRESSTRLNRQNEAPRRVIRPTRVETIRNDSSERVRNSPSSFMRKLNKPTSRLTSYERQSRSFRSVKRSRSVSESRQRTR